MNSSKSLMLDLKFIYIIALTLLCNVNLKAQNTSPKLYVSIGDAEPGTKNFFKDNNVENVFLFDARYIDPTNSKQLDSAKLASAIIRQFPDVSAQGIEVLDVEGEMYDDITFKLDPGSAEFKRILGVYIKTIQLAKALRPNIKWGFYGIPFTLRKNTYQAWVADNNRIVPLLKQCDIFFPNFYIHRTELSDGSFLSNNMKESLSLAKRMNKLVIPFIWNRYYISKDFPLIPINNFNKFVSDILSASYEGKKADGVIWWSAESYYYYTEKPKAILNETTPEKFHQYHDSLTIQYSDGLLKTIKQVR
jgi:hypothetical protein